MTWAAGILEGIENIIKCHYGLVLDSGCLESKNFNRRGRKVFSLRSGDNYSCILSLRLLASKSALFGSGH